MPLLDDPPPVQEAQLGVRGGQQGILWRSVIGDGPVSRAAALFSIIQRLFPLVASPMLINVHA
jgi:hypothetical protein